MSGLCRPSDVRAASYNNVKRIFTFSEAKKQRFAFGPKKEQGALQLHGAGFFSDINPHLLITAAQVQTELLRLGVLDTPSREEHGCGVRLMRLGGHEDIFLRLQLDHNHIIKLSEPVNINIAALWASLEGRLFTARHADDLSKNSPCAPSALPINVNPIDFEAHYFMPVIEDGSLREFCGRVTVEEKTGCYRFETTWSGYPGMPLFDEEGKVVGVIYAEVGTLSSLDEPGQGFDLEASIFTPFSVIESHGLLEALLKA